MARGLTLQEQGIVERNLIDIPDGTSVLPEDAREYSRALESLPNEQQDYLLPRTLLAALQRFATNKSGRKATRIIGTTSHQSTNNSGRKATRIISTTRQFMVPELRSSIALQSLCDQ